MTTLESGSSDLDRNLVIIKSKSDIIYAKIGNEIFMTDIIDCLPDRDLNEILGEHGISIRASRNVRVDAAKKIIRGIHVSSSDTITSNTFCVIFLIPLSIIVLITFVVVFFALSA